MASRSLDLAAVALAAYLAATQLWPDAPPASAAPVIADRPVPAFPPPPPSYDAAPPLHARGAPQIAGNIEASIERLAQWASVDVDPLRRAFATSPDLYAFVQRHLPAARAGSGASAYYIYQALDECRPYLRLDRESARALAENLQPGLHGELAEERQSWLRDDQRCFRFAGGDLAAIGAALGTDRPGAESEYGSILFERAADSGFAPAVAERALREPGYAAGERVEMLRSALQGDDADVHWQLFRHAWAAEDDDRAALGLAWLIVACRKGYDCSAQAPWYRTGECAGGSQHCLPAQSALVHYWYASSAVARDDAVALARRIESAAQAARWDDVPLPPIRDAGQISLSARSAQIHPDGESSALEELELRAE